MPGLSPSVDFSTLPGRVLAVDVDAAELASGCGELLEQHIGRGDSTSARWLAPTAEDEPHVKRLRSLGLADASALEALELTPAADPRLVERLEALLGESHAELVYGPSLSASDIDRRALARALRAVTAKSGSRLFEPAADGALHEVRVDVRAFVAGAAEGPQATAVICTWNKSADVCANIDALRAQTRPFAAIVVVDNASSDDTAERIARDYPEVRLIVMPHSRYGACETFNIGFASATTDWIAILDDDVVLPPNWLELAACRLTEEPATTAVLSTKIVEPGMPDSYRNAPGVNRERYMSTFRGCASLARARALREAGGYDERLYIYGNERDLTCRLLNLGYRVLQYPGVSAFHKTPFGMQMGKRSLYYHARNAWISMLKYAPLSALMRMPFLVVSRVLLRSRAAEEVGEVADATGTIGIGRAVRETPGAWWVITKAAFSVLANVPYCLRRRAPVRAPDFELPIQ